MKALLCLQLVNGAIFSWARTTNARKWFLSPGRPPVLPTPASSALITSIGGQQGSVAREGVSTDFSAIHGGVSDINHIQRHYGVSGLRQEAQLQLQLPGASEGIWNPARIAQ
jgi:hypothetical protein